MRNRPLTRRAVLQAGAALPLAACLPNFALAGLGPRARRFLVLLAAGGWDTTLVFEPCDREGLDRPAGWRSGTLGGLRWTSAPERPSVDRFFRSWGDRAAILNGIHTRVLGHAAAESLLWTGNSAPGRPGWPALLAGRSAPVAVCDAGDAPFADSLFAAVEPLRTGRSRCEVLRVPGAWDTHFDNSPQSAQFETLFEGLDRLFDHLSRTPGRAAPSLLDEIVVVAVSELGRAPRLNEAGGKHHWPVTSALIAGAGIAGGRVVGATGADLEALAIDFRTGRPARTGEVLGLESLGATLLQAGGLSPHRRLPGVPVLDALLA